MFLFISGLIFGSVNTISIPVTSDSLFLIPLFIGLGLLISCSQYLFDELGKRKPITVSKNKIEDQLALEASSVKESNSETSLLNKLNGFSYPQLAGIGTLAFVALGGTSFLVLQANNQNLPEVLKTSDLSIPSEVKLTESQPSFSLQSKELSEETKADIKKISYISPSLTSLKKSKSTDYSIIRSIKIERFTF